MGAASEASSAASGESWRRVSEAAVGAAELDEFFTAETDAAVTAITALDIDFGLV